MQTEPIIAMTMTLFLLKALRCFGILFILFLINDYQEDCQHLTNILNKLTSVI